MGMKLLKVKINVLRVSNLSNCCGVVNNTESSKSRDTSIRGNQEEK
jgi:hypothetical protein